MSQEFRGELYKKQRIDFPVEGETLRFERVTRQDMGKYLCIASNGVQPSVAQSIFLPVDCKYEF